MPGSPSLFLVVFVFLLSNVGLRSVHALKLAITKRPSQASPRYLNMKSTAVNTPVDTLSVDFLAKGVPAFLVAQAAMTTISPLNFLASISLPSALGYVRREYGVSYGYGGAIAAVALMILRAGYSNLSFHAFIHSLLHAIYGVRLCLFLMVREIFVPHFRKIREKIEASAPPSRLQRTPFIVSCGFLYAFMSCPLLITASVPALKAGTTMYKIMNTLLSVAGLGLALQIIGDTHKSFGKSRGENLITTGVYSIFRHPNYTGEVILWTFSTLAAIFASVGGCIVNGRKWSLGLLSLVVASILGNLGIVFILCQAAYGLEGRQAQKYGNQFLEWSRTTTAGPTLSRWRHSNS